ncbi:MAG TPA: bifunctional shikimate kinase/3-dehydroquinate synthase [Thermoleophilaceae bacterium]|nr:bifunctional shikimate kinase/3-dehydroquinate synthase [Thermoleophilaceae bacterium]
MEALSTQGGRPGGPRRAGALVLVGFMGAGKSSGARKLAAELGCEALDSDKELEAALGEPIEQFFDRQGEAAFREREEQTIVALLARDDAEVVALGGGALGSQRVRDALRDHTVVHLDVRAEDAWRRAAGKGRPLARDRDRFEALYAERRAVYESVADALLPPNGRDVARRALPALNALREARADGIADIRLIWAETASGNYPVFFGRGLIDSGFMYPVDGRRFIVTDANVAARKFRLADGDHISIQPGETEKTLASVEKVLGDLAAPPAEWDEPGPAERGDIIVALGGGVVGDLAGFCAAIYQRGMRHVQVPTTLVAQVDSAYGGKTGVDIAEGKNYAGAYHQPSAVICDPSALETLPPEELAAGYAEVVKTALIAGGPLWARVRRGGEVDDDTILGCLRTKLAIVAEDERDGGRRQVLNLGHTVAHAIESATGYSRYRHGEAVGVGLLAALRLSGQDALRDEIAGLLADHGLPLAFDGTTVDEVVALTERDKKREGGRVPFVLLQAPGEVTPGHAVTPEALRAAVEEIHAGG